MRALGWALAFGAAAWASGAVLLDWIESRRAPHRGPGAIFAGVAVHATAGLALGLCGLLAPGVAWTACALPAAALLRRRPGWPLGSGWPHPFTWVGAGTFLALAVLACAPQWWVDTLAYHLAAPAFFNALHKWVDTPHCQFRYRLLAEAWFGQGLLVGGEPAAAGMNVAALLGLAWLAFDWARELAGPTAGWLAVAALGGSTQAGFLAVHLKHDLVAAAFALVAVRAWGAAAALRSPARTLLTGCALGWALCTKVTAVAPAFGIAGFFVLKAGSRGRQVTAHAGWLGAGFLAAGLPFLAASWVFTGNPVYPFAGGGLGWASVNADVLRQYGGPGYDWEPGHIATVARAAWRFVRDDQPLLLLALPVVAWIPRALWPALGGWVGGLAALFFGARCLRFLFPVVPVLCVAEAVAIEGWLAARTTMTGRGIARTVVAAVLVYGAARSLARADLSKHSLAAAVGWEPRAAFRHRVLTSYDEATREVAARLPRGARLLVIGDVRGDAFPQPALTRDWVDTPVMLEIVRASRDPAAIARRVRQTGAQYLVLNDITAEFMAPLVAPVFPWRPDELTRYRAYWERYADRLPLTATRDGVNGGFALYRLRNTPGPAATALAYLPGTEGLAVPGADEGHEAFVDRLVATAQWLPGLAFLAARAGPELVHRRRWAEAAALLRPCLTADYPQPDVMHAFYGLALEGLGRRREAAAEFALAMRLNSSLDAYRQLHNRVLRAVGAR